MRSLQISEKNETGRLKFELAVNDKISFIIVTEAGKKMYQAVLFISFGQN